MINGTNEETNQKWVFTPPNIFAEVHNNTSVIPSMKDVNL